MCMLFFLIGYFMFRMPTSLCTRIVNSNRSKSLIAVRNTVFQTAVSPTNQTLCGWGPEFYKPSRGFRWPAKAEPRAGSTQ